MTSPAITPADVLVIFGITGDLARKMTFRSLYRMERRGLLDCPIVGVALDEWSDSVLRDHARSAIEAAGETIDEPVFTRLAARLSMVSGNFGDSATYGRVATAIEGRRNPVFYLEIPPSLFGRVVEGLASAGLTSTARVVVEKPFGHDLASARALNADLSALLAEWQIFRIDHFLGKEPAMDIAFLRFANSIFEPLWNRDRIAAVQITMAENFVIEGRGGFYDPVGALRDVVQNHLLQLIGLLASEPPSVAGADGQRDKRVEVFRAIPPIDPKHYVRGQYDGYQSVDGVRPDSKTETYAALRLEIDNWRWAGVPFVLRSGKALGEARQEIVIVFRDVPHLPTGLRGIAGPSALRISLKPATLDLDLVINGEGDPFTLDRTVLHTDLGAGELSAYGEVLSSLIDADPTLSVRGDVAEECWRIVSPVLAAWRKDAVPLETYAAGSDGPNSWGRR